MFDTNQTAVFYGGTDEAPEHRVWLRRHLRDGAFRPLVVTLHNPSIAGKVKNDPTATRGISLALRLGASDLIYTNVVTRIATKATELPTDAELNCPWSDWALREAAWMAMHHNGWLVAAWGAPKGRASVQRQISARVDEIKAMRLPFDVLRLTPKGHPEHPLYLPGDLSPITWEYA